MMNEEMNRRTVRSGPVSEAIVLAGGNSSRMGRDKALLPFGNETLLAYLVRKLQEWGMRVTVAAGKVERADQYREVLQASECAEGVRFVTDKYPNCGPMAGLHSALISIPEGFAFVVACDMPFISHSLLMKLANDVERKADVIGVPGQPFHALYHTRAVPRLIEHLESDKLRMMGLLGELKVIHLQPEGEEESRATTNLNDLEGYRQATDNRD